MTDAAAALITDFFATVLSVQHDTGALDRFLSPAFVDRSAAGSDDGPTGVRTKLDQLWAALPAGHYELRQVVSDGVVVAARSQLLGGSVPVDFADFYRIEGGLIAEHWHVVDTAELAKALS